MRWQELFADLEGQARAWELAERDSEVADRTRAEIAQVTLLSRLHRRVGSVVRIHVVGPGEISGRLERLGSDWALLTTPDETVVSMAAVSVVLNLPAESTATDGIRPVDARTRLTSVLRAIARDRSTVALCLRQGNTLVGTPDRVGADWVDLAIHELGQSPRIGSVHARTTVPFGSIATIRRGLSGWD